MFDSVVAAVHGLALTPAAIDSDQLLAGIAEAQRLVNLLAAAQLDLVAEFARRRPSAPGPGPNGGDVSGWCGISEFASAEIAGLLHHTARGADRLMDIALGLAQLPATAAAFRAGDLDLRRVQAIGDVAMSLPDREVAALETAVLPRAATQTVPQLGRAARRAALRLRPHAAEQRHQATVEDRRTWVEHDGDGRSRYLAEGPTHDILRLAAAVDAVARSCGRNGEATLSQRRFDALTQLADTILDDPRLPHTRFGPPGIVLLADLGALARLNADITEPGTRTGRPVELLGDGPLPDSVAAQLLTHRHTRLITIDRQACWTCDHTTGYQIPDRLARQLAASHPRCAFPGCGVPAHRCDWDHVIPWPQGPTCACNVLPLCRRHHRLKTHTRWQLHLRPDRSAEWVSPTGRRYTIRPDNDSDDDPGANQ